MEFFVFMETLICLFILHYVVIFATNTNFRLREEILQAYAWQMLSGLAYLHYHYIVHREAGANDWMSGEGARDHKRSVISVKTTNIVFPWTPKPWKMKVLNPQYMGYNPKN